MTSNFKEGLEQLCKDIEASPQEKSRIFTYRQARMQLQQCRSISSLERKKDED